MYRTKNLVKLHENKVSSSRFSMLITKRRDTEIETISAWASSELSPLMSKRGKGGTFLSKGRYPSAQECVLGPGYNA